MTRLKTIDEITTNDFYYCYDMNLSKFLRNKGIRYFHKAKSVKDDKIYTMYVDNKILRNAVNEFNQMNKE